MLRYKIVLDSDEEQYNGHKRIDPNVLYDTNADPWDNRRNHMRVRSRTHSSVFANFRTGAALLWVKKLGVGSCSFLASPANFQQKRYQGCSKFEFCP